MARIYEAHRIDCWHAFFMRRHIFFLEAIALGIFLDGSGRHSPWKHCSDSGIFERYFNHWLNLFSFSMGLFVTIFMMFNAS